MRVSLPHLAASIALAALLPCQTLHEAPAAQRAAFTSRSWMFPIHTQDAHLTGGAYGTWACGPDYKVSFHDGFVFYPVLGQSYPRNLPLAWRNTRVRVGTQELVAAGDPAQTDHMPWRYEYRYGSVIEAYEVRADGVEQTFVIAQRPAAEGDLLVGGRIDTELGAEARADQHGAITFCDAGGAPVVRYGEAFAVDATGARFPMTTSYLDGDLTLRLPAAAVARAQFPLTVDPLTTAVVVATGPGVLQGPAIARDDVANELCLALSRASSASDFDSFVLITGNDFSNQSLIYSDLAATWSSRNSQVAFVGGVANKWIVVFQRDFATSSDIGFIVSPSGSRAAVGTAYALRPPAGTTQRNPDVSGLSARSASGGLALVVLQQDATTTNANTANTEVFGVRINLTLALVLVGTPFLLGATGVGTQFDRERPSVNHVRLTDTDSWIVSWQQLDNTIPNDDWDAYIARVTASGAVAGVSFLGSSAPTQHKITPRIGGANGRYLGFYATEPNSSRYAGTRGAVLECQRFDWSETAAAPVTLPTRTIATASGVQNPGFFTDSVAHDLNTASHWAVTYTRDYFLGPNDGVFMARVGSTGGIVEAATFTAPGVLGPRIFGHASAATFDEDLGEFKVTAVGDTNGLGEMMALRLQYDPNAQNVVYGTGCGATISANRRPNAGDEYWAMQLAAAPPGTGALLLISGAPASIALDPIGMNGCVANVDVGVSFATAMTAVTSAAGAGSVSIPLIDFPAPAFGNLYFQWIYLAPGANPANLAATAGLRVQVH